MSQTETTLVPHLACRDAAGAIDFYQKAFGAETRCAFHFPDGRLMHAGLSLDGAMFYLVEDFQGTAGGTGAITLHLKVADADALFNRAVEAGCEVTMPLENMFWGDRYGIVTDPYGHRWSIATPVREVEPEEIAKAAAEMTACEA